MGTFSGVLVHVIAKVNIGFASSAILSKVIVPALDFLWDWLWSASTWAVVSDIMICENRSKTKTHIIKTQRKHLL